MKSAVILAGGRSRRMDVDKAFLEVLGKPLILRSVEAVRGICGEIVVAVSRSQNASEFTRILPQEVRVVLDVYRQRSPVVGIHAGIREVDSEFAAVLSCDLPFINQRIVEYLFQEAEGFDTAIPRWPNGLIEPLHAVYRVKETLEAARLSLKAREFRNTDVIKRLKKVKYVSTEDLKRFDVKLLTFFNINTPEDLKKAESLQPDQAWVSGN